MLIYLKVDYNGGVKRKSVKVDAKNYDLYKLSGNREQYKDLFVTQQTLKKNL
jgi:hypothetical protein